MNRKIAGALAAVVAAGVVTVASLPDHRRHRTGRNERNGSVCELVDQADGGVDHEHDGRLVGHMPTCTPAPAEGCLGTASDGGTYHYVNASRMCCPPVGKHGHRHRDGSYEVAPP